MKNWQAMMPKLETFFQFLKNPDQVCLFEEFLKQEVKRAEASNESTLTHVNSWLEVELMYAFIEAVHT